MKKTVPRIRLSQEEHDLIQELRGIQNASSDAELDIKNVKHGWIKNAKSSLFFTNPEWETQDFDPESINWEGILKDIDIKIPKHNSSNKFTGEFDRIVYTDTHIGMNPNPDGYSLYGGKWDEEEVEDRLRQIIEHTLKFQNASTLIIDDLGDFMDGYDAQTVRKGHDLPQNMDNQKAFDVGLRFKWQQYKLLSPHYKKIIFNNICRSNHSASFDYIVNSAFKNMVDLSRGNAEVNNHRKFLNHYQVNSNIFIITHGKDDVHLKTGFKPHLSRENKEKIDLYIDNNFLLKEGCRIEFSKGDSHQMLFDWDSSERFDYFNYKALSPSSDWVQTNFKMSAGGCALFNYTSTFDYSVNPLFFKWRK